MKSKFNFIRIPLILIDIIVSILLVLDIHKLSILPTKYFSLVIIILVVINLISIGLLLLKNNIVRALGIILSILLVSLSVVGLNYTGDTNKFLNSAFNNNIIETSTYNVIVLKESEHNKLENLDKLKLGYLKDEQNPIKKLNDLVSTESTEYEDLYELYDLLISKDLDCLLLNEAYLDVLAEKYQDIDSKIKIIYSFDIETEIEKEPTPVKNGKVLRPINIYISGSDSRSESIVNKSRSDVNMIVTINPNTHKILLTSIPRDYFVQTHGQTGLKDKLTHTGIYGLETTTKTVEDLFDIKIDYSVKVGMNAVVEVVDLVGGIDVYSDITFNSFHIPGWVVPKGTNHFNGKQALAYSRERYAYSGGDRHRIQNQQQVLEAVLNKVLSDKSILLKYDELLTSLSNLYRTDIPREVITSFVKNQLDTMSSWEFETQWVNGEGKYTTTHISPKTKLYVMVPFEEDVTKASKKIKSILIEK